LPIQLEHDLLLFPSRGLDPPGHVFVCRGKTCMAGSSPRLSGYANSVAMACATTT